ncbi:aminodeoxychorismate lyase, partial [Pseudomonas syringae pv. tagetis]
HLQRHESAIPRLAIPADETLLRAEMTHFSAEHGDGVMKLILPRGDSLRGHAPARDPPSRRILQGGPPPVYPGAHAEQGVRLVDCRT